MIFVLIAAAYLGLWPVPIQAVGWQAPTAPGFTGAYAANDKLHGQHLISLDGEVGPEHIIASSDGRLYVPVASGKILRMDRDGDHREVFADTGGRPLGMAIDEHGSLIVADALRGLLSVDGSGKVSVLADAVDGTPVRFANAVAISRSGKIYLTDSSTRFVPSERGTTMEAAMLDVLEQSCTGRVIEYDPVRRATRLLSEGLCLANGIVVAADEQAVLVAESGRYRVWRIPLDAERLDVRKPGAASVVLDNLPGYPDNLTRGANGKVWLGLAGPRNELDAMAGSPRLREMVLRVPRAFWPTPKPYGHVIAFTENGNVVADLQDPDGASVSTTGVTETADRLYIQSIDGRNIGWLAKAQ
jgi:sugar lactone lactonase YvrE